MTKKRNRILSDSDDSKDSDSEGEASAAKRPKTANSPAQASPKELSNQNSSESATSDDDDEWTMGQKKKKMTKKQKSRNSKSRLSKDKVISSGTSSSSDESDVEDQAINRRSKVGRSPEEGELSSSSEDGVDGKLDDEASPSDNESEFDEEELRKKFDDGYDHELVKDEEDRLRLENMTEKEREQEIYNRLEKREALAKRFEIEKKLRLAKRKNREEKHQKNRKKLPNYEKSSPPPIGKAASRNERRRKMEEKKEKKTLEDLKAERERKKNKAGAVEQKRREILKVNEIYTDDEDGEDDEKVTISRSRQEGRVSESDSSDTDSDNSSHSDSSDDQGEETTKNYRIETKDQLNKIRLTRNELGRWVHYPSFKSIAMGCFVRIGIGNNEEKPVYRIAEIVDVCETGKVYTINSTKTNIGLRLRHGQQERVFRIIFVSNAAFSDSEFFKWKQAVMLAGLQLPSTDDIKKKLSVLEKTKSQKLQDSDVDHIVKQKGKFRKNPFNYAIKKTHLLKEKEMAETLGNPDEISRVSTQLAELEERAEKLDKQRQENIAGITYINDQIKMYNLKKEDAAYDEFKDRQQNVCDPFTRRQCKPVIVSNTKDGQQTQRLIQEMERRYGGNPSKDAETKKEEEVADVPTADQTEKTKELAKDLFDAHDFDIKLDVEVPTSNEPSFVAHTVSVPNTNSEATPRRALNLSDYKKRRGLI